MANVYRWNGREDLALPLYKKVIEQAPDNKDAREGIILTERAMRPHPDFDGHCARRQQHAAPGVDAWSPLAQR